MGRASGLREAVGGIPLRERYLLAAAMALGLAAVLVYLLTTRGHALAGDEVDYHTYGTFFAEGKFWWTESPFGISHPSAWKAPGYPAWVGFWYSLLGESALRVELVQSLLAPLTVLATWALARRLFDPRVAIVSAFMVALFPLVFEYFGLLFPEALATPLALVVLLLALDRPPTPRLALLVGLALGINLLVRPTAFFLLAGVAAAWIVAAGWRRGIVLAAASAIVAALVIAPWTVRNALTDEVGFIPISVQDAAAYGTFNAEAANDPDRPYAWRVAPKGIDRYVDLSEPTSESEFRSKLQDAARDYIGDHPASVPKAVFWNGITRFWDFRPPGQALDEVEFQGRSEVVRGIGLAMYYVLIVLAIAGLWRIRRRTEIVAPVLAMAVVATLAFTIVAGTRYRAPLEPVVAILACSVLARPKPASSPAETPPAVHRA
jgi:4-amino-4-deoxy-L-arabinose transferase-like glycosyltransferase